MRDVNRERQDFRRLDLNLHPLSGGPDLGIIVTGIGDDLIDHGVGVVGVVVEEDQFLGAGAHGDIHRLAPMAVSPTFFAGVVLIRQVLRVVDQHIGTFGQFADVLIEHGMPRLVVGGVDDDFVFGFQTETQASLGMIQP